MPRFSPVISVLPLAALASLALAGAATAQQIIVAERFAQANSQVASSNVPGSWYAGFESGAAAALHVSDVHEMRIASEDTLLATGVGNVAQAKTLVVVELTAPRHFELSGSIQSYSQSLTGLGAGQCTVTLSGAAGVIASFTATSAAPGEWVGIEAAGTLEPGVYTLLVDAKAVGSGLLPGSIATMHTLQSSFLEFTPLGCADDASSDDCFSPQSTPNCNDADCCSTVCWYDQACCDLVWDVGCAYLADNFCALQPPHITCEQAAPIGDGQWVSNLGAPGGFYLASYCDAKVLPWFEGPVYYEFEAEVTGVATASTCNDWTIDFRLAAFEGQCSGPVLLACTANMSHCGESDGSISFPITKGQRYTLLLGSSEAQRGASILELDQAEIPDSTCPADLDGSDSVDGGDLGLLLADWGGTGAADLNADGSVDGGDLGVLLAAWGACG